MVEKISFCVHYVSKYIEMSKSVTNPIFDLKEQPLRDSSILSTDYVRLFDVNAGRNPATEQNSFTFRSQDLNGHYLPSRALLVLKFRVVPQQDGDVRGAQPGRVGFDFDLDLGFHDPELVEHLHVQGVRLVGLDTPSIDPFRSKKLESHLAVARRDMGILEGVVLDHVPAGTYTLIALPLRLEGADASPVRAVLLRD